MKKQIVIVASLCLAMGLAALPAHAQAGRVLLAKIPFNFIVSAKTLAAGDYMMMIVNSHQLNIKDSNGRIVAIVLVNDSGHSSGKKGQIIFHCYGERCFLAEVWPPNHGSARELFTSRAETDLAKELPGKYFALLGVEPQK